jgi:hypothetical protein
VQHNRDGEQKQLRLFGRFNLILLFCASLVSAESFKDFKSSQEKSFAKYADERDNGFLDYLNEQFREYKAETQRPLYEEPKPKIITPAEPMEIIPVGPKIFIKLEPESEENISVEPASVKETPRVVPAVAVSKKEMTFDFYGTTFAFDTDEKIKSAKFYPHNQEGISNFFNVLASSQYQALLEDINTISQEMQLNDWGIYLLVTKLSERVFKEEDNSKLFAWFLFNKLGYNAKVGLANKHVVLMLYSKKNIYDTPNYSFSNKKFYVLSDYAKRSVHSVYSYDKDYPGANKALDLALPVLPKFEENMKSKTLKFKANAKELSVSYEYNQNLIDFMGTYPQADYETYFNAPLQEKTYLAIAKGLKKEIETKEASLGINFVLKFVQNAFEYERDNEQFGREKVMFAQETLFYDKSDCEDRAVLFAYLVKELFKVPVIGVKYKDHMATGLFIPMFGDSVNAGNRRFVIADPTYINASVGQSMPKYKPQRPESFIVVSSK